MTDEEKARLSKLMDDMMQRCAEAQGFLEILYLNPSLEGRLHTLLEDNLADAQAAAFAFCVADWGEPSYT